jgi:hypothetical protein
VRMAKKAKLPRYAARVRGKHGGPGNSLAYRFTPVRTNFEISLFFELYLRHTKNTTTNWVSFARHWNSLVADGSCWAALNQVYYKNSSVLQQYMKSVMRSSIVKDALMVHAATQARVSVEAALVLHNTPTSPVYGPAAHTQVGRGLSMMQLPNVASAQPGGLHEHHGTVSGAARWETGASAPPWSQQNQPPAKVPRWRASGNDSWNHVLDRRPSHWSGAPEEELGAEHFPSSHSNAAAGMPHQMRAGTHQQLPLMHSHNAGLSMLRLQPQAVQPQLQSQQSLQQVPLRALAVGGPLAQSHPLHPTELQHNLGLTTQHGGAQQYYPHWEQHQQAQQQQALPRTIYPEASVTEEVSGDLTMGGGDQRRPTVTLSVPGSDQRTQRIAPVFDLAAQRRNTSRQQASTKPVGLGGPGWVPKKGSKHGGKDGNKSCIPCTAWKGYPVPKAGHGPSVCPFCAKCFKADKTLKLKSEQAQLNPALSKYLACNLHSKQ